MNLSNKHQSYLRFKDKTIVDVVAQLHLRIGKEAFQIVDHWDADCMAVGVARSDDPRTLVYISTFNKPIGRYFVSLESPPAKGDDAPYKDIGHHEDVDIETLVRIVQKHLSVEKTEVVL